MIIKKQTNNYSSFNIRLNQNKKEYNKKNINQNNISFTGIPAIPLIGKLLVATGIGAIICKEGKNLYKKLSGNPIVTKVPKQFKELMQHAEEKKVLVARIDNKRAKNILDIDYWKDVFRLRIEIPAEKLKVVRETSNPKLKEVFDKDRKTFLISEGIMLHGNDSSEKKELLQHFISKAKEQEFDVIHIPSGGFDVLNTPYGEFRPQSASDKYTQIAQAVPELFPKAKEKFKNEKKMTMFVIENVDDLLNVKDAKLSAANSSLRGALNVHTHECGKDGIIWVTTAKDLSKLDESTTRGGRVAFKIDIDKAAQDTQKKI